MICPNCLTNSEVVFSAMSGSLICLEPGCSWERRLDEDQTFELFFGSGRVNRAYRLAHPCESLVHEHAS